MVFALIVYLDSLIHLENVLVFLGLYCTKDGATHSESLASSRTPSRSKHSTSFFKYFVTSVLNMVASILALRSILI